MNNPRLCDEIVDGDDCVEIALFTCCEISRCANCSTRHMSNSCRVALERQMFRQGHNIVRRCAKCNTSLNGNEQSERFFALCEDCDEAMSREVEGYVRLSHQKRQKERRRHIG